MTLCLIAALPLALLILGPATAEVLKGPPSRRA